MAKPIIAAVRARHDLKESTLHTLQEMAHRASIYGVLRDTSLTYLAMKCHCSKQTIVNHIRLFIKLRILRKRVIWVKNSFCAINIYTFMISWDKTPAQMCNSKNSGQNLPRPEEGKPYGSVRGEIDNLQRGLRVAGCKPGSVMYEATQEKIAALTALLPEGGSNEPPGSGTVRE